MAKKQRRITVGPFEFGVGKFIGGQVAMIHDSPEQTCSCMSSVGESSLWNKLRVETLLDKQKSKVLKAH